MSIREAIVIIDRDGNAFVLPVPADRDISAFRDEVEGELGVDTSGGFQMTSITALRAMARRGEL
jgi:hypothetical protein